MNIKKIKDIVKKVVDYHIEGDYHVYTVKNTPLSIRILMTRKYNKKWANLPVIPERLFLIIIWEAVTDATGNISQKN